MEAKLRLLIACPELFKDKLDALLRIELEPDWRKRRQVEILSIPEQHASDSGYIAHHIRRRIRGVDVNPALLHWRQMSGPPLEDLLLLKLSVKNFKHLKNTLRETLRICNLDLISRASIHIAPYEHGEISRDSIEAWRDQFRLLGSYQWIADRILQYIDFWAPTRLMDCLLLGREGYNRYSHIALNLSNFGRSAGVLGNRVQKRLISESEDLRRIFDLADAIDQSEGKDVLYLEDCLLSGDEFARVISSLLAENSYRKPKAKALADPLNLHRPKITARFAVTTDYGTTTAKHVLGSRELRNFTLSTEGTTTYRVLTDCGRGAHASGALRKENGEIIDFDKNVHLPIFAPEVWGHDEKKRETAKRVSQDVGAQLFRNYLEKKGEEWGSERILQAGLGLGLALAFSHSVPKLSLPILWATGPCTFENKRIDNWQPLFPRAAS